MYGGTGMMVMNSVTAGERKWRENGDERKYGEYIVRKLWAR